MSSIFNMSKYNLCLLLATLSLSICNAQTVPDGSDAQLNLNNLGNTGNATVRTFDNRYQGVEGSPFYNQQWLSGDVITIDDKIYRDVQLKYNAHEDELIMKKGTGNNPIYVVKDQVKSFTLTDTKSRVERFTKLYKGKKFVTKQYFKIVFEGSFSVYEEIKITLLKADFEGGYSANRTSDEFKMASAFYYRMKNSYHAIKLKSSSAQVAKIFADKKNEMKAFIDSRQLDCKSAEGLAEVFAYYDGL